ncbi:YciI family protein [Rhodococcus gannanensis]|uniref:YciI family protein n=1 Tax=Rhodococcus gannanensis TaxID=1960308 RepID=A0ABW4P3K0_9NOCA
MKYLLLIHAESANTTSDCTPEDWMVYDKQVKDAGIFVSGESLADLTAGTSVKVDRDGTRSVTTDGPYPETRELVGGFYVIDVPDLDVALDWAARCPGSQGGGRIVVSPIADWG